MSGLSHVDGTGAANMVDVGNKAVTQREARAGGTIRMQPETLDMILADEHPKGDVLATARIAGIMAAKRTHELIPLCHALNLSSVKLWLTARENRDGIDIESRCRLNATTGVEMEALTAVSVAALTLYDMCKAVDRGMVMDNIRLLEKQGGQSGHWQAPLEAGG